MKKTPEIGRYLDDEEKALVQAFETSDAPVKSGLTPKRKREIEPMARATMTDERAKIPLRVPTGSDPPEVPRAPGREPLSDADQCTDPSVRVRLSGHGWFSAREAPCYGPGLLHKANRNGCSSSQ